MSLKGFQIHTPSECKGRCQLSYRVVDVRSVEASASRMGPDEATALAIKLMSAFAKRTGVYPPSESQRRYLWTDAFAVCNFLELFKRTDDEFYRQCATELINQIHRVLGRYRADDVRQGWISGLDEQMGRHHPTKGGLRIGKPLEERRPYEPIDERLEWERDGQYFHYLTKWMHALCRAAFVTGDSVYVTYALELAAAAFNGFVQRSAAGEVVGIYWKVSTDLSRPLTYAMGMHDALDGFITFREVQHARLKMQPKAHAPDLRPAIDSFQNLCRDRDWITSDPLGIGGLMFDLCRLSQLTGADADRALLETLADASQKALRAFLASRALVHPPSQRLAFRELGLAIGLEGVSDINRAHGTGEHYRALADEIVNAWLPVAHSPDELWQAHADINDIMLVTALTPQTFLSIIE
jgi:hypothetical protein